METDICPTLRVTEQDRREFEDTVATEYTLTIILNNQELVTLLCSPAKLEYLALGFLSSENLIKSKGEIKEIILDEERGTVRVMTEETRESSRNIPSKQFITSGGGRGTNLHNSATGKGQTQILSSQQISTPQVFALMEKFVQCSKIFKATGGVHSAALCDTKEIIIFSEDIGRHNAIDKIFGECFSEDIPLDNRIILTSGRVSSEIMLKVAKRNILILISKSAPTNIGTQLAEDSGMTLMGFVRGKRMNICANSWRVTS
ncbi:formate dehydrogenase accessory sulfurtransferase FdhD [Chloroflexota bacterium]